MREIISTALGIDGNNNEEIFSLKSSQRTKEKSLENHRCSVIVLVFRDSVAFSCFIRVVVVAHKKKRNLINLKSKLISEGFNGNSRLHLKGIVETRPLP